MKKARRIVAVLGLIIIALLYISFFVLAALGNEASQPMLFGAFASTIIVPVLLYMLQLVAKNKQAYIDNEGSVNGPSVNEAENTDDKKSDDK